MKNREDKELVSILPIFVVGIRATSSTQPTLTQVIIE